MATENVLFHTNLTSPYQVHVDGYRRNNQSNYGEKIILQLPRLYNLEEYEGCIENKKLYCKAAIELAPKVISNQSYRWIIPGFANATANFPHYNFNYGLCIEPNNGDTEEDLIFTHYKKYYETEHYKLESISRYVCRQDIARMEFYDVLVLLGVAMYFTFVIWSTIKNWKLQKQPPEQKSSTARKIMSAFSLRSSWESLMSDDQFGETKCLQGIRLSSMCWIILFHSLGSHFSMFSENANDRIMTINHPLYKFVLHPFLGHSVQWFFFLSAFLLVTQVYDLCEKNGSVKIKQILLILLNRYLRLIPPIIVTSSGIVSNIPRIIFRGHNFDILEAETEGCPKNLWRTLLLFHNNLNTKCLKGYWYVSADFQLYAMSLLMLYFMFRFRNVALKIYVGFLISAILLQVSVIYRAGLPGTLPFEGEANLKFEMALTSEIYGYLYFSTLANTAPYLIGVGFGLIYCDKNSWLTWQVILSSRTCWLGHCIISLLVFHLAVVPLEGLHGIVIGSLLKPLYMMGIGILVCGMLSKLNDLPNKLFEHKLVQTLAKVTYYTYIYHFIPVYQRCLSTFELTHFSVSNTVKWYLVHLVMSFAVGAAMHLMVESPLSKLQKLYIPSVRKSRVSKTLEEKKNY